MVTLPSCDSSAELIAILSGVRVGMRLEVNISFENVGNVS